MAVAVLDRCKTVNLCLREQKERTLNTLSFIHIFLFSQIHILHRVHSIPLIPSREEKIIKHDAIQYSHVCPVRLVQDNASIHLPKCTKDGRLWRDATSL